MTGTTMARAISWSTPAGTAGSTTLHVSRAATCHPAASGFATREGTPLAPTSLTTWSEQNIRKSAFTRIALWEKRFLNATIVAAGMYFCLVLSQQRQRMLLFFCVENPA